MRRLFLCIPFICILVASTSPIRASDIPVRDAQIELLKHIKLVETPGFYVQIIDEVVSPGPLGMIGNTFVKENNLHLDYLSKVVLPLFDTAHPEANKPEVLRERFERAKESGAFLDLATDLFAAYLKSKGQSLSGWTEKPKARLSWSDAKVVAVRFFMPVRIQDNGRIGIRICVMAEGMVDYAPRNFQLEGFVFNAIFTDVKKNQESILLGRLEEHKELARVLRLSTDKDVALKRACGAIWALFYNDASLEKIIREAYQRQREYFPFTITE